MWLLCDPVICRFLGPPLFPAAHAGLPGGIRSDLYRGAGSRALYSRPTHNRRCAHLIGRPTWVINSLVLNGVSDGGCLPEDSAFRRLPVRSPFGGGCLRYSSMLAGYASEVAVMHWIGRWATGNNEHVRYTVPFLIGAVSLCLLLWCGPIAAYGKGCPGETGG